MFVVDDDPAALRIVEAALGHEGYSIKTTTTGADIETAIQEWKPDLILLDVQMPGVDGLETLKRVRNNEEYVSTLFVSGQTAKDHIVLGLDSGADDYICKPYDIHELLARVRCHFRIKDIRDELKRANKRLEELAATDDLTGLYNMRSMYEKLTFEIDRAMRFHRAVGVIMFDLDNFKAVNDQNDHLFGSYVLTQVGQIIKDNMRKVDFAGRYGGDEFVIVLSETNLHGAKAFCERLRQMVEEYVFSKDGYSRKLTISVGLVVTELGAEGLDAKSLMRAADHALYEAKESGRNRVTVFDPSKPHKGH